MTTIIKKVNIPVNRAEGDLEVRVDVTDGIITDAWSTGTMYRGFEGMMTGRKPLDGLVITPRICGICSLNPSGGRSERPGRHCRHYAAGQCHPNFAMSL